MSKKTAEKSDSGPVREAEVLCLSLQYTGMRRNGMRKPDVTAYYRPLPYGDTPKDGCIGVYRHIVFKDRMSRLVDRPSFRVIGEILCP